MSGDEPRPIYGPSSTPDTTVCMCMDMPALEITLKNMLALVRSLKVSVEKYLPAVDIAMSIRGAIATPLKVPPFIMVRMLWDKKYPGIKGDKNNFFYRSTIRDFYFAIGRGGEWSKDPLSLIVP